MVRLESIGSVNRKLASVSRLGHELLISEDCPESEQLFARSPKSHVEDEEDDGE